jgi:hypothetical protein
VPSGVGPGAASSGPWGASMSPGESIHDGAGSISCVSPSLTFASPNALLCQDLLRLSGLTFHLTDCDSLSLQCRSSGMVKEELGNGYNSVPQIVEAYLGQGDSLEQNLPLVSQADAS